jgi:transcriptional regulator with XRE-family HTH domain
MARPTGRQIAAARALLGMSQADLASRAAISIATLKRMEGSGGAALGSANNVTAVQMALEAAGVEFTGGTRPGARMRTQAVMTPAEREGIQFAEDLLGVAIDLVGASRIEITGEGARDPKIVALTLLCRTITNFRNAIVMVREEAIIEARTLVRLCYENLLWVAAIHARGAEFIKEMQLDEAASRKALGELSLKFANPETRDDTAGRVIRAELKRIAARWPRPSKFRVNKVAAVGVLERSYLSYARLSLDAVHPSLMALSRHLTFEQETDGRYLTLSVVPPLKPRERLDTIDEACSALMGVCVAVNELLGGTNASDALRAIVEKFWDQGHHSFRLPSSASPSIMGI